MKIVLLPGDGIGKEVTPQVVKVLRTVLGNAVSYEFRESPIGGVELEMAGDVRPSETLELTSASEAILPVGTAFRI